MSDYTGELGMELDADLQGLDNQKEVIVRDGPFEAPAKSIVPGPYYKNIEEVMPELAEGADEEYVNGAEANGRKLAVDRRDFMRLFSAGAMLASAACVRRPAEKVVPYVNQPLDQLPGVPVYYATTCECPAGCGIVVKTREGRPVKIEGNPEHPISQGATCTYGQASLQALYHPERRKTPQIRFVTGRIGDVSWDEVYSNLADRIKDKKIAILTGSSTGNRHEFFRRFLKNMGSSETSLYTYEPLALAGAMAAAHKVAFGVEGYPRTDLRRSSLIVGVGAEFLDIGVSPVYETKSWSSGHTFRMGHMGRFVQFENRMTSTGSKATQRHVIGVGDELAVTMLLVKALVNQPNVKGSAGDVAEVKKALEIMASAMQEAQSRLNLNDELFDKLAKDLLAEPSLVMVAESGATSENATVLQLAGVMANVLIGAYGNTLHLDRGWMNTGVNPGDMARFMEEAKDIEALFIIGSNPVFTLPDSFGIKDVLKKIPTVVSMQPMPNETDEFASFILNTHHNLESWGDEESVAGFWSLRQPTIRPFTNSQQAEDILLWTAAKAGKPMGYSEYRNFVMERWQAVHKLIETKVDFDTFFKAVLRRGFVGKLGSRTIGSLANVSSKIKAPSNVGGKELRLVAHLDNRLLDGRGADRPVLQEVGDSMTTIAWDTWVGINPNTAAALGLRCNDLVKVEGPGGSFEASIYPLPGLHPNAIAVPRGNGHATGVSRVTDGVGANPLVALGKQVDSLTGDPVTAGQVIKLVATGKKYRLAAQQKHNDIANRKDIVKTVALTEAAAGMRKSVDLDTVPDLYPEHPKGEYRWGMSVDLSKCTGCSACMVACTSENNIPQGGREQILMGREMHWIRLDRYFDGDTNNPSVTIQPVMCQHCNHAPCEAVCPVYATTHDADGINAQTYNRCVGTRYCANACPYKVRRFNWWTHKWNVIGERPMDRNPRALNPDVTVRTRGIMEKCTFCVQRIRDAKHAAKDRDPKARVMDGDVRTACQQVCPADAIMFGNLDDPNSRVSQTRRDSRAYLMLGGDPSHGHYGIKTLPNVSYLAKVTHDGSKGMDAGANPHNPHGAAPAPEGGEGHGGHPH